MKGAPADRLEPTDVQDRLELTVDSPLGILASPLNAGLTSVSNSFTPRRIADLQCDSRGRSRLPPQWRSRSRAE